MGQSDTQFSLSFLAEAFAVDLPTLRNNAQNQGVVVTVHFSALSIQ